MEIVTFLNKRKTPGLVVLIDFEKCFDRIEHRSIAGAMNYFGFGTNFIRMMMLLYNQLEMCMSSKGWISDFFCKTRGSNQGCLASPLVYNYCSETMAHLIMSNPDIEGINIAGIKNILGQFADDTAAYLKYDKVVLDSFTSCLVHTEANTGLKVSYDKTTIYQVGSLYNTNAKLITQKEYKWSNDQIDTLGVLIPCDGSRYEVNFNTVIEKVRKVTDNWVNRKATLFGKVLIVNTLIGLLFVYKMTSMLDMDDKQIRLINGLIKNFIWCGKRAKIGFETLMKKKEQGGACLVNIKAKQDALKIAWIVKLNDDLFLSNCAYTQLDKVLRQHIWLCNLNCKDIKARFDAKDFWVQVLIAWSKINVRNPQSCQEIREFLWLNSNIRINNKPVVWNHWLKKDLLYIKDIVDENGNIDANLDVNWLELKSIWNAIPPVWKLILKDNDNTADSSDIPETVYRRMLSTGNPSRFAYDLLIDDDINFSKYANRWIEEGLDFEYGRYQKVFINLYRATKVTKYRDFQYRLLLNKLVCNRELYKWEKRADDLCTFCRE